MNKYIGIDIGGTNYRVALVDEASNILELIKEKNIVSDGAEVCIKRIIDSIKSLKGWEEAKTIGIGAPGPLDPDKGVILQAPNLSTWNNYPLTDTIAKATGKNVYLQNDANVAGLGEAVSGAGKGYKTVFYITISTGIGGGLVINEKIHGGAHYCGAEIGNMITNINGKKYNSALNAGAVEVEASGTALIRIAKEKYKDQNIDSAEYLFSKAEKNDSKALEVIEYAANQIAIAMSNIAHVIDPDIFVLGGGMMASADIILPMIKSKFKEYVFEAMKKTKIEIAVLEQPGIIGAAMHAKGK